MAVGIILGEFVPSTSVVLEKVKFVEVSLPLGPSPPVADFPLLQPVLWNSYKLTDDLCTQPSPS